MDTLFHHTLYWVCDYLYFMGLTLIHVGKMGPRRYHIYIYIYVQLGDDGDMACKLQTLSKFRTTSLISLVHELASRLNPTHLINTLRASVGFTFTSVNCVIIGEANDLFDRYVDINVALLGIGPKKTIYRIRLSWLCPFYQKGLFLIRAWMINYIRYMEMKLLIHSQTPMAQPLKVGIG